MTKNSCNLPSKV